jgi:hypothetical protein
MPVLELRVKGYQGAPVQVAMALRVCEYCRRKLTVDDLLTDDGWLIFCSQLHACGKLMPTRKLTKIHWEEIPNAENN